MEFYADLSLTASPERLQALVEIVITSYSIHYTKLYDNTRVRKVAAVITAMTAIR